MVLNTFSDLAYDGFKHQLQKPKNEQLREDLGAPFERLLYTGIDYLDEVLRYRSSQTEGCWDDIERTLSLIYILDEVHPNCTAMHNEVLANISRIFNKFKEISEDHTISNNDLINVIRQQQAEIKMLRKEARELKDA